MWSCRNCSTQSDEPLEVCPACGAVDLNVSAADAGRPLAVTEAEVEVPTEYDVQDLPDPGTSVVECYISVTEAEASGVASRLRDLGIQVFVSRDDSEEGPVHRVRVPIVDLGRALAVIDLLHRRRISRR